MTVRRWQQSRHALGSEAALTLVGDMSEAEANDVFAALWQKIETFERRFSRFLPESELTKFNAHAGQRTEVSPAFAELLQAAQTFTARTNGLYNPFVLPALQTAGYVGSWPQPAEHNTTTDFRSRELVDAQSLQLGDGWAEIPPNSALDFGGIGKGFLLDKLGEQLDAVNKNVRGFWLSLGGDILCDGVDADGQPWKVRVQKAQDPSNPHDSNDPNAVGIISNENGQRLGIATSGITKRRGTYAGRDWHHLIDPRTGAPATTDVLTASVAYGSATEADVFAKCLVILGSPNAADFVKQTHAIAAVIQRTDDAGAPNVMLFGKVTADV